MKDFAARACVSCMDTGWIERVGICPCRAPEKASEAERRERYNRAVHDPACEGGWIYSRSPCDCDGAQEKRRRR